MPVSQCCVLVGENSARNRRCLGKWVTRIFKGKRETPNSTPVYIMQQKDVQGEQSDMESVLWFFHVQIHANTDPGCTPIIKLK